MTRHYNGACHVCGDELHSSGGKIFKFVKDYTKFNAYCCVECRDEMRRSRTARTLRSRHSVDFAQADVRAAIDTAKVRRAVAILQGADLICL